MADGFNDKNQNEEPNGEQNRTRLYVGIGCFAAGCVALILAIIFTFTIPGTALYFIIASVIFEIAAVFFINTQQQRFGKSKICFAFKILSYVVMVIGFAIIAAGTAVNGTNS